MCYGLAPWPMKGQWANGPLFLQDTQAMGSPPLTEPTGSRWNWGSHSALVGELLPNHATYTRQRLRWKYSPSPKPIHREAVETEGEKGVLAALLPAQRTPTNHRDGGAEERANVEGCFKMPLKQPRLYIGRARGGPTAPSWLSVLSYLN